MTRWLPRLLKRIHRLALAGRVRLTTKAAREVALLGLGLNLDDVCDVLAGLTNEDFVKRVASSTTGEWLYVFNPVIAGATLYLKLVVRAHCVVISFHEDEQEDE